MYFCTCLICLIWSHLNNLGNHQQNWAWKLKFRRVFAIDASNPLFCLLLQSSCFPNGLQSAESAINFYFPFSDVFPQTLLLKFAAFCVHLWFCCIFVIIGKWKYLSIFFLNWNYIVKLLVSLWSKFWNHFVGDHDIGLSKALATKGAQWSENDIASEDFEQTSFKFGGFK